MHFRKRYLSKCFFRVLLAVCMVLPMHAAAHRDHELERAQGVMYKWAHALMAGDQQIFEAVLADDITWKFELPNRSSELDRKALTASAYAQKFRSARIVLDFARTDFTGERLTVSDIVVVLSKGIILQAWSVSISKRQDSWLVDAVVQRLIEPELARKALPEFHPEQVVTTPVAFSLRDGETGEPVYARVHIADGNGEYWPPRGRRKYVPIFFRDDVGGDVKIGDRVFAYVTPEFTADLAPGAYEIVAYKGMEYTPARASFEVDGARKTTVELQFERWIDLAALGWFAGDTHTHFLGDHDALIEAEAEDLNVINVLATKWGRHITDVGNVTGAPSPVSRNGRIVYYNEETRHNFLGHTILHPLKTPVYPLTWGDIPEGVPGGGDYPTLAHQADAAREQGGLVTWAHFPDPQGELAIDAALGKIDSVDLITWGDPFVSPTPVWEGAANPPPVEWWYTLLNTGARLPATAGTDKMMNTQVSGSVRTYAWLGGAEFTYAAWVNAIRQGRTFITTGPVLEFSVNGEPIGADIALQRGDQATLAAKVRAPHDRYPWERLEIVFNGRVIASAANDEGRSVVTLTDTVAVSESGWFAARVFVPPPHRTVVEQSGINRVPPMAHTSPVYVTIPGSEVWSEKDAAFLARRCEIAIDWARNRANFLTEAQRDEVVALFEQARAHYRRD